MLQKSKLKSVLLPEIKLSFLVSSVAFLSKLEKEFESTANWFQKLTIEMDLACAGEDLTGKQFNFVI